MKLIFYLLLIYLVYKVIKAWTAPAVPPGREEHRNSGEVDDIMVKDPVCGVYFPKKDGIYMKKDGEDIYFCSPECKDRFTGSDAKK
jgi:YHS domain-containing protein